MTTLDPQQRAAVESSHHETLVLAGAGSGKTRVIIERIAHLVENKGVSPYEICAFTFTRKAAGEMKRRLEDRIERPHAVTIGTMHALGLGFLKIFGEKIGLRPKNITVYSPLEEAYLLKDVAMSMGYHTGKTWKKLKKKEIDAVFEDHYQRGIEPEPHDKCYDLFRAFFDRCRENNALTYGSILIGFHLIISELAKHKKFKHIIVDEIQDIDTLQWAIIRELCLQFGAELFVVGDIDQSIFEWRGATPGAIIDNQRLFAIYRIETNYRSMPEIVHASNRLIEHNVQRIPRTMNPIRTGADSVQVWNNIDSGKLPPILFREMTSAADHGRFAVLARNHVLLGKASQIMKERNIDHVYVGEKAKLTNTESFRRFHAFLKLIVNPFDNFSFLLIYNLVGISPEEYGAIRKKAAEEGKSHFQVWTEDATCPFSSFFYGHGVNSDSVTFGVLSTAAWGVKYMGTGSLPYPEEGWKLDVDESFRFIMGWLTENPDGTISQYLDWLATYDIQDEIKETDADIQLMTIHAAKGLEWPCVILMGVNEGILPSTQAINNDEVEAERRLAYVAMTRARDRLVLACRPTVKESEFGKVYENPVSRFLKEAFDD